MSVSERYQRAWESYWQETSDAPGEAVWDTEPALAAVPHVEFLVPFADTSLPVVDLGCGNGTQTRYLATRFARAFGVDIASAAVEHARRADPAGTAEFRRLDIADAAGVAELHEHTGDTNVYMRAVIHQAEPAARPEIARGVAALLGRRGRAFLVELTEESKAVLREAVEGPGGPPPKIRRVFEHGLRPADALDTELPDLLAGAGLEVLAHGFTALPQTEHLADGRRIDLPAQWFVVRTA